MNTARIEHDSSKSGMKVLCWPVMFLRGDEGVNKRAGAQAGLCRVAGQWPDGREEFINVQEYTETRGRAGNSWMQG